MNAGEAHAEICASLTPRALRSWAMPWDTFAPKSSKLRRGQHKTQRNAQWLRRKRMLLAEARLWGHGRQRHT
eukprot:scaffold32209_cov28-Tisochrysis_lutea.AAC.3